MSYTEMDAIGQNIAAKGTQIKRSVSTPSHEVAGQRGRAQARQATETQNTQVLHGLAREKEMVLRAQNVTLNQHLQALPLRKEAVPQTLNSTATNAMQVLAQTQALLDEDCQKNRAAIKEKRQRYHDVQTKVWQDEAGTYVNLRAAMRQSKYAKEGEAK